MTKQDITAAISALRSKSEVDSISPADVAALLDMVATYADSVGESAKSFFTQSKISRATVEYRGEDDLSLVLYAGAESIEIPLPIASDSGCGLIRASDATSYATVADDCKRLTENLRLAIFNACGISYNSNSKLYSLNVISDLTEAQAWDIVSYGRQTMTDGVFRKCSARTILTPMNGTSMVPAKSLDAMFVGASGIEVAPLGGFCLCAEEMLRSFVDCPKLKRIGLDSSESIKCKKFIMYSAGESGESFSGLPLLESVYISDLQSDIQFRDSPNLKAECVQFMIDNAANNGAPINIYLHPAVLANLPNSIVVKAISKNINLAALAN